MGCKAASRYAENVRRLTVEWLKHSLGEQKAAGQVHRQRHSPLRLSERASDMQSLPPCDKDVLDEKFQVNH